MMELTDGVLRVTAILHILRVCIHGQETLTFCVTLPGSPGDKTLHILTLRHDRRASPSHSLTSFRESIPVAAGHVGL